MNIVIRCFRKLRYLAHCALGVQGVREQLQRAEAALQAADLEQLARLRREQLHHRGVLASAALRDLPPLSSLPISRSVGSLEDALARLGEIAPAAYRVWRELLDVSGRSYEGFPTDSCSVRDHAMAAAFRCFALPYLRGRVLDIGCGPQPVPSYLIDYPVNRIFGIDPLSRADEHPFAFVRGVAEFLPWEDDQFETVVIATSLDHVLLLDRALAEVHRVLQKPSGRCLLWVAFIADAAVYDPYRPDIDKIDQFHLFHFSKVSFEAAIAPYFNVCEHYPNDEPFNSHFFCLRPK